MSFVSACGLKEVKSSATSESLQEDSFCRLMCLQLRLLLRFSLADAVYNVSYFGLYVSEMGYLLSFVFINAWIS